MYFIGVDLGTSAMKLLLTNEQGQVLRQVSRSYPLQMPRPGWSEQNPADWAKALWEGIPQLTAGLDRQQVAGLAIAGQMHGLVALDESGQVLRPAILWNDGRTQAETRRLNVELGEARLAAETGNIAFAGFTAPKLLWMQAQEPSLFARIRHILLPKDYLVYLLTGEFATDMSDASGMLLLDVSRRRWSQKMLDFCSLQRAQLPRLYESWETVGTLCPAAAAALGLPATVRVAAGAGDNAAAAIGTGTVGTGHCNISLGTSGTLFLSHDRFIPTQNHAIHSFCHADGGWHLLGCMLSAASCLSWWSELLGPRDPAAEQAAIDTARLGRNEVFFLPYLMGERTPHNDTAARGCFLGLGMDTTRPQMTQSVLEGVAFGLRDALETARETGLSIAASTVCGGGARSGLWRRILSNVLALPLGLPETEQGPGLGAALLGAVSCGVYASVGEAAAAVSRIAEVTEPEPELVARYQERYQAYRNLYPALKPLFPTLGRKD